MASATVTVHVHNTDAETWKALAQVFDVGEGDVSKWVELNDQGSGIKVLFFETREPEAGVLEDEIDAAL
jgi:hypothetical protein